MARATEGLRKETDKLRKVAEDGQRKVKELGNVQNWAEMLERDFLLLEETLRLVRNGNRPREGGSGDYEGSDWETSGSEAGSWSGSESEDGERDDESIAGDLRRGKVLPRADAVVEAEADADADGAAGWGRGQQRVEELVEERQGNTLDGEGDTIMEGVEREDKGKGKEVEVSSQEEHALGHTQQAEQHLQEQYVEGHAQPHQEPRREEVGGSSTATGTESSGLDGSSNSVYAETATSTTS